VVEACGHTAANVQLAGLGSAGLEVVVKHERSYCYFSRVLY
jgi:hypothetical protein